MNIAPLIGGEPLTKLQPARISRAYARALPTVAEMEGVA